MFKCAKKILLPVFYKGWTVYPQAYVTDQFLLGVQQSGDAGHAEALTKQIFKNVRVNQRQMIHSPQSFPNCVGGRLKQDTNIQTEDHVTRVYRHTQEEAIKALIYTNQEILENVHVSSGEVQHVITTTEFPACPPLDIPVVTNCNLQHATRQPLVGLGCVGGIFTLTTAAKRSEEVILIQGVETGSRLWATQYPFGLARLIQLEAKQRVMDQVLIRDVHLHQEQVTNDIVVAGLVGDAAMSTLVVSNSHPLFQRHFGALMVDSIDKLVPEARHLVGTTQHHFGTRLFLSPLIPKAVAPKIGGMVDNLLSRNKLHISDIKHWCFHPGGPKVLTGIQSRYHLSTGDFQHSWDSLAERGNCFSVSIFDVFRRIHAHAKPGEWGIMMGVGPGLHISMILIRWE